MHKIRNILSNLPSALTEEVCETLTESETVRIERIVSRGQATPEGEWYDQTHDEWVLVISGSAGLSFEDEQMPLRMVAGDYCMIPAHCRHRVAWSDPDVKTVWLALHIGVSKTL